MDWNKCGKLETSKIIVIAKLIGEETGGKINQQNKATDLAYPLFTEIISNASENYEWLIIDAIK